MKKAIIFIIGIGIIPCCFAQETPLEITQPIPAKVDFRKKSKDQKTGAIVMVSAGGAMIIAGFAIAVKDAGDDFGYGLTYLFDPNPPPKTTKDDETLATVLIVTGAAAILGSIGLFVSAHKNKKKALGISFKNELAPQLQRSTVFNRSVPSLSFSISL